MTPLPIPVKSATSALLFFLLPSMDIRLEERKKIRCIAVQIRHLDEKIALLSEDDSLVKSIIARWAHKMEGPVQSIL